MAGLIFFAVVALFAAAVLVLAYFLKVPFTYSLRSIFVRKTTTFATMTGIAFVVLVFAGSRMLANSVEKTMGRAGHPDIAIIMSRGADGEMASTMDRSTIGIISSMPEVRQVSGGPDSTADVLGVLHVEKVGGEGVSNLVLRGVSPNTFEFRSTARIVEGRAARPGTDEVVVGRAIAGRFRGVALGQSFPTIRNRRAQVVGVFEDHGSAYESETWGDLDMVNAVFPHGNAVSAIRVRLLSADPSLFQAFKARVEGDRRLNAQVQTEVKYYEAQSKMLAGFLGALGTAIAFFFIVAAVIGATITMYAAVSTRSREIGTLRALGFSRGAILLSFLVEATVLAGIGGLVGTAASLSLGMVRLSFMNFASWSEMVFALEPSAGIILSALAVACVMGVMGGFFPAVRAARRPVLEALRA